MPKREDEPTERIHLWVYKSDAEWLRDHFGNTTGVSRAIRNLVRAFRRKIEAKAQDRTPASPVDVEV